MHGKIFYDRIVHNYNAANSIHRCAAVLKANAYGFGLSQVSRIMLENTNCEIFFVDTVKEAETVYKNNFDKKSIDIMILSPFLEEEIDMYQKYSLIPLIQSENHLEKFSSFLSSCKKVGVFLETGFRRTGITLEYIEDKLSNDVKFFEKKNINIEYLITHLKENTKFSDITTHQKKIFDCAVRFFPNAKKSLAASRGLSLGIEYFYDFARIGTALYGNCKIQNVDIQQSFEVKTKIIHKSFAKPGYIGYGSMKHAHISAASHLAMIPIGYTSGISINSMRNMYCFCPRLNKKKQIMFGAMSDAIINFGEDEPIIGETIELFSDNNKIMDMTEAGSASLIINYLNKLSSEYI